MIKSEDIWEFYNENIGPLGLVKEAFILQRSMADTLIHMNLNIMEPYMESIIKVKNSPHPHLSKNNRLYDPGLMESYFGSEFYKVFHRVCDDIQKPTGDEELIYQCIASVLLPFTREDVQEDAFIRFVYNLESLEFDLGDFIKNMEKHMLDREVI